MARPQEKPPAFTAPYSPIAEGENEGFSDYAAGGGCLSRFCFWCGDDGGSSHNGLLKEEGAVVHRDSWMISKLKKLKEYSELVAGPKWKNLIRRMGRLCNANPKRQGGAEAVQFQYSPQSYALNFAGDDEEGGTLLHSFSSRYVPHALINDHQRRAAGL